MSKLRLIHNSAIFILIWNGLPALATVYDSDGSSTNIQSIHDSQAVDGDTITIPIGTFSWTTTLIITKAITLQGQTTTDPVNGTAVQNTIVEDNISNRNNHIIYIDAANGGHGGQRITGIAFIGQNTSTMYNGAITVDGGTDPIRIDHCYFHGLHCYPTIGIFVPNWGVLDHNVKDDSVTGNEGFCHFWPFANADLGDSVFEQPAGFGGPNFLFLEDNYMDGGTDLTAGGKMCVRHCIITGNNSLGEHGTGRTFPNGRGGRAYEVYNCQFRYNNNWSSIDGPDGGSAVYHDNTERPHTYGIASQVYRALFSFGAPFYGADGRNPWDLNDPHGLYDSGTFTGNLTDSSKHWIPNQWVGFSLRKQSDGSTALIEGNTANTLTIGEWKAQSGWGAGAAYQINKVLRILDQPGLGAGSHINRNSPAWPNPASEPCYSWNNTNVDDGSSFGFTLAEASITFQEGRDYFNNTLMPGYTPYVYPHPLVNDDPPPSPTPSATVTPSATATATPPPSPTSPPSPTPTATATTTPTPQPSSTPTATPAATATPTATATPGHTPRPHPSHGPDKG